MNRSSINLKRSVCTEDPDQIVHSYDDREVNHVANNGIEREGGITNVYEQATTFATAGVHSVYTKSGDLLQVDASHNVRINDSVIGNVGSLGIAYRGIIPGYSDAAWTDTFTIIGIVKVGDTIRVDEYDPATRTVINTRSTTFTMPSFAITNVALVKYRSMAYADNFEVILSNSKQAYILRESGATCFVIGDIDWTTRTLSANSWRGVCYSSDRGKYVAVGSGGTNYCATSPDGAEWANQTLAANTWNAVCYASSIGLFSAVGSGGTEYSATSPDAITWTAYTGGAGLLWAGTWKGLCWSPTVGRFVAVDDSGAARVGWSTDGYLWTGGTITNDNWKGVTWAEALGVYVAVASTGGVGNLCATSSNGNTWSYQAISSNDWRSIAWSPELNLLVAVGNGPTNYCATSSNGTAWTNRTIGAYGWNSVTWSPERMMFIAVANDYWAESKDGITWVTKSMATGYWRGVCWSSAIGRFVAVSSSTNYAATGESQVRGTNFGWRFLASNYILGSQGISGSWFIGDIGGFPTAITDSTWCAIDQFQGTAYSRAILTFNVKKNTANLLTGIGEVGYNQAGAYSATPTYYGVALAAVTATFTNNISGPGYAEATFTRSDTGTNIYYYLAPIMGHNTGIFYDYKQSQTQTLANGYGKLNDIPGNTLGNVCSLRVPMVNGQPSLLSAGVLGQNSTSPMDCLGVPLTNLGEFDEFFVPHVVEQTGSSCLLYRYNGNLFYVTISNGGGMSPLLTDRISRVSDNLYLINSISPVNVVNVAERTLALGPNDYNGRILFRSAAAIVSPSTKAVGIIQGRHVNSIDTGDKLITQTFSTSTNIVPGIELPSFVDRAVPDFGVNIYLEDVYSTTYQTFNVVYAKGDLSSKLYVADTRIPVGMGYTFTFPVMQTEVETILLGVGALGSPDVDYDYLCYELGNTVPGTFQTFRLYGQTYLFDGINIYLASFSGSAYGGKDAPLAPATGMTLIAAAPTVVYFLSSFDNSIYTFDGGRSLTKFHRLNKQDPITNGVYNVRDNALLLDAGTDLIWIRDGIISINPKSAGQLAATLGLFDTDSGIYAGNTTTSWRYNWTAVGTIVPLVFQAGFFGAMESTRGIVSRYILTLYSSIKAGTVVAVTYNAFDQDRSYAQTAYFPINTVDYTPDGMLRLKFIPEQTRVMASSIGIQCASKIVILDITAEYDLQADATIAANRSR